MKLLIVSHPCVLPTNQQQFAAVARQTGWDLLLVVPANWRDDYGQARPVEACTGLAGSLQPIPVWLPGNIPLHVYRSTFLSLLRTMRPDAIYVHHEPFAAATAQVFWANRQSIHCPAGFYAAQNIYKRYPPPFCWTERWIMQTGRFAFPVSPRVEQVLRDKEYQGPSTVLPLGIDPQVYRPHPQAAQLRDRLCLHPDNLLIGYLGRLAEEKGLSTLLEALSHMPDLPWQLVVVGTGPYDRHFDARVQQLGLGRRVQRLGYVPHEEAPLYLSAFDVLALPSETRPHWKEQFGRVIIEALACGTPVVGSDSGEIPYLLAETAGGLVFPEGQAGPLAAALGRLLSDSGLRRQLADRGREAVLQRYTLDRLAGPFARTLEAVVGG